MSRGRVSDATSGRPPYRVGLTGNIAAGKSAVAEVWRGLGAAVVDADDLARRAVEPGSAGLAAVAEEFGTEVLRPDGRLDREALGRVVFADPARLRRLEEIVHPEVARLRPAAEREALAETRARWAAAGGRAEHHAIVVHDIPLLFEADLAAGFDEVVLVHAPEAARLARLVELRALEPAEARRRVASQTPSEDKIPRADRVIRNDGGLEELRARATRVWRAIEDAARAAAEGARG